MINFQNCTLLGYQHTPVFLEAGLRYRIDKNFSIQGLILDLTNDDGVSGIWSGINDVLNEAKDYSPIYLNNIYFGNGKITDITFTEGSDVRTKQYTINITANDSGNLSNALSGHYSGINWENCNLVDTIDETFAYNQSEDGTKQYTHNINLKFNSGAIVPDTPINLAKTMASGLFAATNLTGFLGAYNLNQVKKYYSETYNLINNSCSFNEQCSILNYDSGFYSFNYTHQINLDERGVVTVTENGQVKGMVEPIYDSAVSGYKEVENGIFDRVSGVFYGYNGTDGYLLNRACVSKGITTNRFNGTVEYSAVFTNDPAILDKYRWSYQNKISKAENNVITVEENGEIKGYGRGMFEKYDNAFYGYGIVRGGISGRLAAFYDENVISGSGIHLFSSSEDKSHFIGNITYSQTWSDDNTFGESGFKKTEIDVEDRFPVHAIGKYNIVGVGEIVQESNQSTAGTRNVSINILGSRDKELTGYLNYAKGVVLERGYNQITGVEGDGTDGYISNVKYNLDKFNNKFGFNIGFNFHGHYRSVGDFAVDWS